ncbi:putative ubiquitin-like-specific protease 1B isoform X2 [Brachypodium distachyon]|uniref:Ubiquitin-like protease family profile domain-containing protein n=1 Tax=Brachypodium distachyon TaxID=15368 RepID=A0A2K2DJY4_BRADI|nr:putative ubiquitin-like-specific protease 1B isoform X2 [Brachypodium distachyon]PNT74585.1 hypothetical protein BRADI_1g18100v3 [Brachypodium distachyon]|eukprot:XP_024312641.1 putative ubiquitin-like-specific protease 1B isoform X2 [Brachypodium distachyon]
MTSAAAAQLRRKRRTESNSPTIRPRRRLLCPSHFLAIRPFGLRFALSAAPRRRPRAARRPAAAPPRRRPRSSVVFVPAVRPFVLRYFLPSGSSSPRRRRKASGVDMGNFVSQLLKGWVEGSREAEDLSVAKKVQGDKASAVRRGTRDASKITLEEDLSELFTPLTKGEESEVYNALYGGGHSKKIVAAHEPSNIEITKETLGCLRPRGWLNDEVVNLYLELLKERAEREPTRFLKCHFFNTFFYKKLASGKTGYDYESVRRWTAINKLGYELVQCDKIFVPVHRDMHWCLAVINMKEKTFQYLDSFGGMDYSVLRILARYIMDELKDKSNIEIDINSWLERPVPFPLQHNGWDCGMFMLKFIDFHSRGLGLSFSQKHMEYFRKRTAKEILRLRAD